MTRIVICCVVVLSLPLLLAACGASTQGPTTWLDRPLDGATIPVGPVTIQAHASDAGGVAGFKFFVDDDLLVTVPADGGRLAEATAAWNPTAPGTYVVRARATDPQGNVGPDAFSSVTVGQPSPASLTPTFTYSDVCPTDPKGDNSGHPYGDPRAAYCHSGTTHVYPHHAATTAYRLSPGQPTFHRGWPMYHRELGRGGHFERGLVGRRRRGPVRFQRQMPWQHHHFHPGGQVRRGGGF